MAFLSALDRIAVGDDYNLHVLGQADELLHGIAGKYRRKRTAAGPRYEDLRDLILAGKIQEQRCRVLPLKCAGVDVKVAREVQVPLDGLAITIRQIGEIS